MLKKFSIMLVIVAMALQMVPYTGTSEVSANTGNFSFNGISTNQSSPTTVTEERITLTGSISNVDPSSITYDVIQLINGEKAASRENLTSNVYVNGFNIQVFNVQLFPGLNQITFKGNQGGGQVSSSFFIDFRNGPVFSDLVASLYGNNFPLNETGTTVVHSTQTNGLSQADISITGKAMNAQQVTVIVNGSSKTYSVNTSNGYTFAASPITLRQGKNLVTIRVFNSTQTVETTREIAFYNGNVTFFDVNISEDGTTNSEALEYSPTLLVTDIDKVKVTGKVIVPSGRRDTNNDNVLDPVPFPTITNGIDIKYDLSPKPGTAHTYAGTFKSSNLPTGNPQATDTFFVYEFTKSLGAADITEPLTYNKLYSLSLEAPNEAKMALFEGVSGLSFTLKAANAPYIHEINYLQGYKDGGTFNGLSAAPLNGSNQFGMPIAIEVLVGNPGTTAPTVAVDEIKNINGNPGTDYEVTLDTTASGYVSRTVNGTPRTFYRAILVAKKLPFEGTQTLSFSLGGVNGAGTATTTLLFGPFVAFNKLFDTMNLSVDTTEVDGARMSSVMTRLDSLAGRLENINDISEIRYAAENGRAQTVFLYVNNTLVPLVQGKMVQGNPTTQNTTKQDFLVPSVAHKTAFDALFNGENEIRIVFQGAKSSYEKKLKLYLIPNNLPEIPAKDSLGVFPYSTNLNTPTPNDPEFPQSGSIYTTKRESMHLFGTFDFIDLGQVASAVKTKVESTTALSRANYILRIESTNAGGNLEWDLSKRLEIYDSGQPTGNATIDVANTANNVGGLVVRYDLKTQQFSFILQDQKLNADGSSSVYNIYVYNSGKAGPRASYRIEVDPIALPYELVRPLAGKRIVNKNFVEVIISASGAESVEVNKLKAEQVNNLDIDGDAVPDYTKAFRVTVDKLKVGTNKISFTITSGTDKVTDSFEVVYAPTNIPGAQYLEAMKNSHKVFDGAVNLTFAKGTTLVRRDYNVPAEFKNQVYTNHKILFGIANGEDGVVDRHEFETLPANFDAIQQGFGTRFRVSYPTRFTKASNVYWIDAGLADDISGLSRGTYDPLTYGVDPYQFPGATGPKGTKIPTYDDRPDERELVTSKTGKLTLSFDPSMREGINTMITVFRYDVKNKVWENMGGVVDAKKNTITVPFDQFGYYVVGKMVYSFTDITSHPYARNYMEAMYSKGVMNSAGFDEFGANMYITRGEFARMVVQALDLPLDYELSKPHFDDVPGIINPDALWDFRYVETAARKGIIRGTQPRTFEPGNTLTRAEGAVIIARALEMKLETDPKKIDAALSKAFKDHASVGYYAKSSVAAIAKKGYIQGSPVDAKDPKKGYVFEPNSNLLRSDAAIIVSKMMKDLKKLPAIN
ncbi:S-layer homology domain-containing protein [Paenibacillus tarimensis]|uniref:S-layer homology domain-containing protein n=1 Tax=Paenibacillus tarimensis TaxID=416012 RepID=UPI001F40E2DA|nr:S-layer homology domain-containing protein [Paenibacillus tarimensis]MCF2944144.1 S-layer homology domain-containing protein [Paenibacillus tarimensis]